MIDLTKCKAIEFNIISGWQIEKNYIFDLTGNVDLLDNYCNNSCIFYARGFKPNSVLKSHYFEQIISINCTNRDSKEFSPNYIVNIEIFFKGENVNKSIFEEIVLSESPYKVVDIISLWMKRFSNGEINIDNYSLSS